MYILSYLMLFFVMLWLVVGDVVKEVNTRILQIILFCKQLPKKPEVMLRIEPWSRRLEARMSTMVPSLAEKNHLNSSQLLHFKKALKVKLFMFKSIPLCRLISLIASINIDLHSNSITYMLPSFSLGSMSVFCGLVSCQHKCSTGVMKRE